jgi:hypothetical protein
MSDTFFTTNTCDRCGTPFAKRLNSARTMSWFNEQTICTWCSEREKEIKKKLPNGGANHEGCGFIPDVEGD